MAKQDISIRKLVDKVTDGELTLPEMQRRYVWTSVKVRDLMDSLYRGYPSGTILVWETDDPGNFRKLQVENNKESPLTTRLLLLDGQQRITSLSAIINGEPIVVRNKRRPIEILFNLEHPDTLEQELSAVEEDELDEDDDDDEDDADIQEQMRMRTFVVGSRGLKNDPAWISVTDVFQKSDSQILRGIGLNSDDPRWDKYTDRLGRVRKIRDYEYVMVILDKKMSYEEVTEIFVRVNSLGAKLRGSDLALAQLTSRWRGFMNELENFAAEFGHNEDYIHETGIMVKTLVAIVTGQSRYKTINRYSLDEYTMGWEQVKNALRFAFNFVNLHARIDNLRLLSSPFLLIVIAVYARIKNERLTEKEVRKVLLWFYVSHMRGRFSLGSSESILDSDLAILRRGGSIDDLLTHLRVQVRSFHITEEDLRFKNRRSAYFSMLFLLAKQRGVKDWFTGTPISEKMTGRTHAVQFHHIIPKSLLRDAGVEGRAINDIANLTFIGGKTNRSISNKLPKVYLAEVLKSRGSSIYPHHHLPEDSSLWEIEKFEQFLVARRRMMVQALNDFIESLEKGV